MSRFGIRLKTGALALFLIFSGAFMIQSAASVALASPYTGSPPAPTNLTMYFHNISSPVTVGGAPHLHIADTWNDTVPQYASTGYNVSSLHYLSLNFTVYPQLSGPLGLNGTVYSYIYMTQKGSSPNGGSISLSVFEDSPSGTSKLIGTGPSTTMNVNYPGAIPTLIRLTGPKLDMTVNTNYSLSFNIVVSGNSAETYSALWGKVNSTVYYSEGIIPASSYLEVSNIYAVSSTGAALYSLPSYAADKNVTVYSNLTDPLGAYDFFSWPVDWIITNSANAVVDSGVMSPVSAFSIGINYVLYNFTFNYSAFSPGEYKITVNGTDNTMHNYPSSSGVLFGRNAFGSMQLYVGLPPVHALFTVQDSLSHSVRGAHVSVYYSSSFIASNITNSTGVAGIYLAGGNYTVRVSWQSIEVGTFAVTVNNTSNAFSLKSKIYSPEYTFEDQSGAPLLDAFVYMRSPNGTSLPLVVTGASGAFTLSEMARGNYSTVVFWHSSMVFNGSIYVNSNGNEPVNVGAYSQSFKVVSSSGSPVPTANVLIVNSTSGTQLGFNTTNASGMASAVLPYGTYAVTVYWKGIQVYLNNNMVLDNPTAPALVLNSSIYTITIDALSSSGSPLSNVIINVFSNSTGTFLSAVTGINGHAAFELAGGNYVVTASFSTTYDLTPVSQQITRSVGVTSASTMILKFTSVYPPVTSTNLFYVIVVIVLVIAIAAASVILLLRRSRKSAAKDEPQKNDKPGN